MAKEGDDSRASSTTQLPYPGLEWHRNGRALVGDGTGTPLSTAGPAPVPVPYVPPWRAITLGHTTVTLTLEREFPTGGESLHHPCSGCPYASSPVVPSTHRTGRDGRNPLVHKEVGRGASQAQPPGRDRQPSH